MEPSKLNTLNDTTIYHDYSKKDIEEENIKFALIDHDIILIMKKNQEIENYDKSNQINIVFNLTLENKELISNFNKGTDNYKNKSIRQ